MTTRIRGLASRRAVALGLVAGAWIVLSGWAPGVETPRGAAPVAVGPDRILVAQAEGTPVSYSSEQADRGEERYTDNCADCHGESLDGGLLGGAPLKGLAFEEKYGNGGPAGVMFEVMTATMPPDAPGRYSPSQYADLMAYILKKNGYRAGGELPSDVGALYTLNMTK